MPRSSFVTNVNRSMRLVCRLKLYLAFSWILLDVSLTGPSMLPDRSTCAAVGVTSFSSAADLAVAGGVEAQQSRHDLIGRRPGVAHGHRPLGQKLVQQQTIAQHVDHFQLVPR